MSAQIETKNKAEKTVRAKGKAEMSKQAQKTVQKAIRRKRAQPRADKAKTAARGKVGAGAVGGKVAAGGGKAAAEEVAMQAASVVAVRGRAVGGVTKVPREVAERAFRKMKREIVKVSLVGRPRITASVPAAVEIGLGALPYIEKMKDEIRKVWPQYDVARAGRLRDYALAALFAHLRVAFGAEGETRLRALLEEAAPLRERVLRVAEVHAYSGDLDAEHVADIRRGTGHRDTALDLIQLAMLFRAAREVLAGRTPVTEADIDRAAELGSEIIDALGQRRLGSDGASVPAEEEEERSKAFWLYFDTYEESRRGMAHLRWYEGDVDQLVPSLFSQNGRRRGASPEEEPGEGETPSEPADPSESD